MPYKHRKQSNEASKKRYQEKLKALCEAGITHINGYTYSACIDCGKLRKVRLFKGKPINRRCRYCCNKTLRREKSFNWKGGRRKTSDGYISVYVGDESPFASMRISNTRYMLEHRLVVAKALGRCLYRWEIVHHKPGYAKDDNRYPETLELVSVIKNFALDSFCRDCQLRKEIRLLRWQMKELQEQLTGKLI